MAEIIKSTSYHADFQSDKSFVISVTIRQCKFAVFALHFNMLAWILLCYSYNPYLLITTTEIPPPPFI
jgi:hypothetical protein